MVVLLHGHNPGNVVKGHRANTEVFVIGNFADFPNKAIQVWSRDAVNGSEEISGRKTIVISGGTTALKNSVSGI
jgi:hypothetical protein